MHGSTGIRDDCAEIIYTKEASLYNFHQAMASHSIAATEMDTINVEIGETASKIKEIEGEVVEVKGALQGSRTYLGISDRQLLLERLGALEKKEEQLRKKEEQLRKEKEQLRTEKEQLRKKEEQLREKELRLLLAPSPPAASGSTTTLWRVTAAIVAAKKKRGVRGAVSRMAEEHIAFHGGDPKRSIRYGEVDEAVGGKDGCEAAILGTNDLVISVVFKDEKSALQFESALGMWYTKQPLILTEGDVVRCGLETESAPPNSIKRIFHNEYIADNFDSPEQFLRNIPAPPLSSGNEDSVLSSTSLNGDVGRFQRLEDDRSFPSGVRPYRCPVVAKAQDMRLANSESNVIATSWLFHQLFDGVHHETELPQVVVEFGKNCGEEIVDRFSDPPKKRYRVDVNIEYLNRECAEAVSLKPGSKQISDTKWESFLHVQHVDILRECLDRKSSATRRRWRETSES